MIKMCRVRMTSVEDTKANMDPDLHYIISTSRMKGFVHGLKEAREIARAYKDIHEVRTIIGKLTGLIAGVDDEVVQSGVDYAPLFNEGPPLKSSK